MTLFTLTKKTQTEMSSSVQTITPDAIREFESMLNKMKQQLAIINNKMTPVDKMMHDFVMPVKGNKTVIRRMTCSNETTVQKNVMRKVTIVYEYNLETHTLRYGASVFKTTLKNPEHFERSKHLTTAVRRFEKKPVVIQNFADEPGISGGDKEQRKAARDKFHLRIRKQLFTYGCRHRNPDDTTSHGDDSVGGDGN